MLFQLADSDTGLRIGSEFYQRLPSQVGLVEKDIENWIAENPDILFGDEILTVAQSVSGERMADVLALDSQGRLIVVEIKRGTSSRDAIGQLLEYASEMDDLGYEGLDQFAQEHGGFEDADLYEAFLDFTDREEFSKRELGDEQLVFIVAPESDRRLEKIVEWLRSRDVPIELVSFSVFADADDMPRVLQIDDVSLPDAMSESTEGWAGHWFFNTNETHAPGAYKKMFENDVAAVYGYSSGPDKLTGAEEDQTVLAYVNDQGIRALGTVVSGEVEDGSGIFLDEDGNQKPGEYHLRVEWEVLLSEEDALSVNEASELDYNLPVRTTFGKLRKGAAARRIAQEVRQRAK